PSPFPLPWQLDPDCVHAVRRQQFARIEGGEVDGGDPDRPAPPRPALHHAGRAVAPAEPALRRREIAVGDGGPDQRRGDGLPVVPHGVHYIHREPVFPRQPSHQLHVTRPPASEPVELVRRDRKSTRLNSSHVSNSYAVFCLKKKNVFNFYTFTLQSCALRLITSLMHCAKQL